MNIALWVIAGGLVGWTGHWVMRRKAGYHRPLALSIAIGTLAGFIGGSLLAPMLGAVAIPNVFSPFSLVVALATAAAFLITGSMISGPRGK